MPDAVGDDASISVVVPCHNYGRFLPEAIESLDRQTRSPDEILIVDDGSTDDTAEVIAQLTAARPHIRVLSRAPAHGAIATFNDGVRATSGAFLVILSADDRASPSYLEDLSRPLVSGAGFAYPETRLFGAIERVRPARPFDARRLWWGNYVNGSAMFRRELWDRLGGFDERFSSIGKEDWAFWLGAAAAGYQGVAVTSCYLEYRRHAGASRNVVPFSDMIETRRRLRAVAPESISALDLAVGVAADLRFTLRERLARRSSA